MPFHQKTQEYFDHILDKAPKCHSIFIAGGAVADFDKASDIDIFFHHEEVAKTFMTKFDACTVFPNPKQYNHNTVLGYVFDFEVPKLIQVIKTEAKTAMECMDGFDISTHRKAYDGKRKYLMGKFFTLTGSPPRIILYNSQTWQRYFKVCLRYGHTPDMGHLLEMQGKLALDNFDLTGIPF